MGANSDMPPLPRRNKSSNEKQAMNKAVKLTEEILHMPRSTACPYSEYSFCLEEMRKRVRVPIYRTLSLSLLTHSSFYRIFYHAEGRDRCGSQLEAVAVRRLRCDASTDPSGSSATPSRVLPEKDRFLRAPTRLLAYGNRTFFSYSRPSRPSRRRASCAVYSFHVLE